jgi:hypothetical protein
VSRRVIVIMKDATTTLLMQRFGFFEDFKFIGYLMVCEQHNCHHHLGAKEALGRLVRARGATAEFANNLPVGFCIPGRETYLLPGHLVLSSGEKWVALSELVEKYQAPLVE